MRKLLDAIGNWVMDGIDWWMFGTTSDAPVVSLYCKPWR